MKISATEEFEGYENFRPAQYKYTVYLNREVVDHVVFADDIAGVIKYVDMDNPLDENNNLVYVERSGHVIIEAKPLHN